MLNSNNNILHQGTKNVCLFLLNSNTAKLFIGEVGHSTASFRLSSITCWGINRCLFSPNAHILIKRLPSIWLKSRNFQKFYQSQPYLWLLVYHVLIFFLRNSDKLIQFCLQSIHKSSTFIKSRVNAKTNKSSWKRAWASKLNAVECSRAIS